MKRVFEYFNKLSLGFVMISTIVILILMYGVIILNVFPVKYIILLFVVFVGLDILSVFLLLNKRGKKAKIIGYILNSLIIILSIISIYYLDTTSNFLSKAFKNRNNTYKETYYILTKKDSYNDLKDLENTTLGYYEVLPHVEDALKIIDKRVKVEAKSYDNVLNVFTDVDKNKIAANLIEKNLYDSLIESDIGLNQDNYKILFKFDLDIEEEITKKEVSSNYLNVYIGGPDFTNTNYDFNMIVTINKDTHKILLTSTPRDFYINIAGKNMKDILGYAGNWGINTSIRSLENLYNIDINNYVKIEPYSLVKLVDTLGGVSFCSDISFTTTHTMLIGEYNDSKGQHLTVNKGCKNYSGLEILTIARERKAYPTGDRQRQKNCQQIMINIFNKIVSFNSLTKYNEVLNSVSETYTTNLDINEVTNIIKSVINGTKWTFETQSVTGSDSSNLVHLKTVKDYVMIPNQASVDKAINKIKEIMYNT